jgi:hypothetical protein
MRTGIFLALLGLLAGPALAQHGGWRGHGGAVPLDRLLPEIRRSHPGTFYDAEGPSRGPDGQLHYHLKWMTPDGRVIWLDTNARTGRVLGIVHGRDRTDFYHGGPRVRQDGGWAPRAPHRDFDHYGGGRDYRDYNGHRGGYARHPGGGYGGHRGESRGGHRGHGR